MASLELINRIKRITIISLVQDDELMETLILKGDQDVKRALG